MARKPLLLFVSLISVWVASVPCPLAAEENQAELGPLGAPKILTSPQRLVESSGIGPAFEMQAADELTVRPISGWNAAGMRPLRNGVERPLPEARLVVLQQLDNGKKPKRLGGGVLARSINDDALVWAIALRVDQSWRMRIRLGDLQLPKDTRMWVYSETEKRWDRLARTRWARTECSGPLR